MIRPQTITGKSVVSITGAYITVFGVAMGLIALFLPTSCSAISGLILLLSAMAFITGLVIFIIGRTLFRNRFTSFE